MFDDDPLDDWIEFETFRILSDDYEQCPSCEIGILLHLDTDESETSERYLCDTCGEEFVVKDTGKKG